MFLLEYKTIFQYSLLYCAGWVGEGSHVVFGKKFPGEKGGMRQCTVVMQQPVLSSPKFGLYYKCCTDGSTGAGNYG
jgi:hypothetical protein